MKNKLIYGLAVPATATLASTVALLMAPMAFAQDELGLVIEEVIVSARRREESLQEVPISMTVLTEAQVKNANISNAGDIALYTPSLSTNSRFGEDNTSFAIRGFTQELRTTASVGTYFAEVVSPRGANSQTSGDGAGPGMLFDLENIQVLKGPQGTLFGRNTTGGAVLLTPKKPTDVFEGYLEASAGNFDMQQLQTVVNVPVNDSVRIRFGIDSKQRDGHLNNVSGIGPDDFGDVDYLSARASIVWDVANNIESYTIFTYSKSENNGSFPTVTDCNTGGGLFGGFYGALCQAQLDQQAANGDDDFWDTAQTLENPRSEIEEWRAINTTTWEISDDLTFKNIISYAELNTVNNSPIWGTNYQIPTGGGLRNIKFASSGSRGDLDITDSSTFTEELQLQGTALDDSLTWQIGAYYETTEPENPTGQASPSNISCDWSTLESTDPSDWRCNDLAAAIFGQPVVGTVSLTTDEVEYTNKGIYAQGTYDFNEQLSMTLGLRNTWDETRGKQDRVVYIFGNDIITGANSAPLMGVPANSKSAVSKSKAPTWVLGLDYKPNDDTLLYAKYSRGYRQGSVNVSSQPGLLVHDPEKVDTYEIGSKYSFSGKVAGYINTAIFYNDFEDQQLQNGLLLSPDNGGVGSTAIVNAGKSEIWGVEIDSLLQLTEDLTLNLAYSYLDTEVKEIQDVNAQIAASGATPSSLAAIEGDELPFAPKQSFVASLSYRLTVDDHWGEIFAGLTYVYTDKMRTYASEPYSPLSELPSYEVVNINFNWSRVMSSPVDLSFFVNNVFEEEYFTYSTGNYNTMESETGMPGHPRMYGLRVKYNFGVE